MIARAKGVRDRSIIFVHTLRNAMLPVITVVGDQASALLNGAVVVETIFGFPGVGKLMIDSTLAILGESGSGNVSLGMPIDRASVDHGTAFDIAGTGRANHVNMLRALACAGRLAASRKQAAVEA